MNAKLVALVLLVSALSAFALDPNLPVVREEGGVVVQALDKMPSLYGATTFYESAGDEVWARDGWRNRTDADDAADEQAVLLAEAARIAAKPVLLKKAENRFLMALGAFNQRFPANPILPTDGFLEIGAKLKASGMPLVDQLELSQTLNAYWDLVLFHGGRFGDVQWHPEPEAFPTDMQ